MKEGVIQQVGTPQEIYAAPVNLFVASFIGTPQMNFIPGKLSETGFENESFRLSLPDALKAKLRSSIGKEVILGLRPEALAVSEGIQENTIPVASGGSGVYGPVPDCSCHSWRQFTGS